MNANERRHDRPRKRDDSDESSFDARPAPRPEAAAAPVRPQIVSSLTSGDITPTTGAIWAPDSDKSDTKFWALPDKNLKWWVLREDDDSRADGLLDGIPKILSPEMSPEQKTEAGERCRQVVMQRLKEQYQEDAFNLLKRMLLGGTFLIGGIFLGRFLRQFDVLLILGALGYSMYAGLRYGIRLLKSMEAAHRPFKYFAGEPFVANKLAGRIARALEYRRSVPAEKRGESPDEELLDANAYRKLIREGVTTKGELAALGKAIERRLEAAKKEGMKTLSDVARAEGLDPESASLYRDLTLAASEIAVDPEFN